MGSSNNIFGNPTVLFDDENPSYTHINKTKINNQSNAVTNSISNCIEFENDKHISCELTKFKLASSNYPITPCKQKGNVNRKALGDISNRKEQHGHISSRTPLCNKKCNFYHIPRRKNNNLSTKLALKRRG